MGGHLEQRAAVYEQLGDASFKSTLEGPNAIGYFQQALALYEQLGDRRKQATIHSQLGRELAFGSVIDRQDIDQGIEHLHQACTILEGLPQSPALSLAYVTLGVAYAALLRTQEQASWTAKALDTAERLRSPVLIAQASTLLGAALDHTGELSRGRTIREQGWQLASEGNFAFQADENRLTNVGMSVNLKDPKTALAWAARRPDYHTTRALAIPMVLVRVYAMLGDFETAVRLLQEQEAVTGATRRDLPGASLVRGELALRRGDWDQAQRHMEAVHQQCLVTRDYRPSVTATPSFAEACVQLADVTRAEERLLWVLDLSRAGGSVANQVRVLPQLGALYVKTDRLVEAEACLRDVQSILAQGEDWFGLVGDVALAEGLVRAAQDRWPEANAAFRRAIEVDQRYELRWDEAKVYYEWGCALIGRGEAGRDEARLHLGRAMDMWEAMGAGPWAEKCRERLAELT
ncbi:MAG: hypothetical protein NTZ05_20540 [Chloroflexi bacterium]|nr:hypothetical protein [Chloroflexota bacterium]